MLIAGGTGITPLMSIIRFCNDKKLDNKVKFIYSVRTPNDIIYKNELEHIKKSNKNFDYDVTVTRTEGYKNWNGARGRIDLNLLKKSIEDVEESIYYLCGPKEFVENIISMIQNLRVKKEQIKTDIWG